MDHDIDEVVPGHEKKCQTRRQGKPDYGGLQAGVVVPQGMSRLQQHGHKGIKHHSTQGRSIGDQTKEKGATPAEGLHA
jgi:hypothetical protein